MGSSECIDINTRREVSVLFSAPSLLETRVKKLLKKTSFGVGMELKKV